MASKPVSQHAIDQHEGFLETARALGCDESEAAFDEKLKVIARQSPREMPPSGKKEEDHLPVALKRESD